MDLLFFKIQTQFLIPTNPWLLDLTLIGPVDKLLMHLIQHKPNFLAYFGLPPRLKKDAIPHRRVIADQSRVPLLDDQRGQIQASATSSLKPLDKIYMCSNLGKCHFFTCVLDLFATSNCIILFFFFF